MENDGFVQNEQSPSDDVSVSPSPRVPASPRPRVSASPNPGVSASSNPRLPASPRLRVPASVLKWVVHLSRFGLAALFLFTAAAKLIIVKAFAANVAELLNASGFNYQRWMWPTTITVIIAEVTTAILLLLPRTVRLGALCAAVLLIGFAGYALYYVYVLNGEPLECGCFGGIIGSQLGVKTALRNLLLLIPAILVFIGHTRLQRIGPKAT